MDAVDLWVGLILPLLGFFWASCPCCGETCEFFSDDFNRADSTSIGSDWTEVAQDWDINTNRLRVQAAAGIVVSTTPHPDAAATTRVTCTVRSTNTFNRARIILNYQDTSNYYFAELIFGTNQTLKIYTRVGGVDTQQSSIKVTTAANADYTFTACLSSALGVMSAGLGSTYTAASIVGTQDDWGLGSGSSVTGSVMFDNVVAEKTGDVCPECETATTIPACPYCLDGIIPLEIKVVLGAIDTNGSSTVPCSDCADLNGTYYLPFVDCISFDSICWKLTIAEVCDTCPAAEGYGEVAARMLAYTTNPVFEVGVSPVTSGCGISALPTMRWKETITGGILDCCSLLDQGLTTITQTNCIGTSDPTGASSPCKNNNSTCEVTSFAC